MSRTKLINSNLIIGALPQHSSIVTEIPDNAGEETKTVDLPPIGILPLRDIVAFPGVPVPVSLGRDFSIALAKEASKNKMPVLAVLQRQPETENPDAKDLFSVGTICRILNLIQLPDGTYNALLLGEMCGEITKIRKKKPYITADVRPIIDFGASTDLKTQEVQLLLQSIDDLYMNILDFIGQQETQELRLNLQQFDNDPEKKLSFMCVNSPLTQFEKQEVLEVIGFAKTAELFLHHLDLAYQKMELKADIQMRTREDMSRQQKEMFLKQQMQAIQDELGAAADDNEIEALYKRADQISWSEIAKAHFEKEMKKLERYNPQSPEYSVQYSYIDTLLNLPWDNYSKDECTLQRAEKILNRDHFGMKKVKERIIEHLAVLKLRNDLKAPIVCLFGPPGVGKTSLGRSIAEAMGREYVRVSLGGLHDEAEIRGHRRTYIGAMPGRIITALQKCGTGNPVFVLDEIDKIGQDYKGDPSTALLEVLDPEQNVKFHDNYLDCDYDLSKILFIATANNLSGISSPLLDRMEIINVDGYIPDEKVEIARRHLIPKALEQHGFEEKEFTFTKSAVEYIINFYTRESGVRQLEKKIAKIMRKVARIKASGKTIPIKITDKLVREYLGREEVLPDLYENNEFAGVVTGLAWTQVGGEILFIETSVSKGKGKLTLTGNLGDVMKESAAIALQYLRAHSDKIGLDTEYFDNNDVHVHVPEGAIPKDGPSAGITMATSIASAMTGRKVRSRLAMTGEITLRGKVLPVGGIKEKILAAKRAGITDIMLSSRNRRDIEEIGKEYIDKLTFHYVDRVEEVLDFALLDEKAPY